MTNAMAWFAGFLGAFIASFILTIIFAFVLKRYKAGTGLVLFFYSTSIGYAVIQGGGSFKSFIVIIGLATWTGYLAYVQYKKILRLQNEYGNTKILKRIENLSSLLIHMGLLEMGFIFFNIMEESNVRTEGFISACIFLGIGWIVVDHVEDVIHAIADKVIKSNCITKEQVIQEFGSKIRKYKIGKIDYYSEAFELLEIIGAKYTDIEFIGKRNSKDVAICMESNFYNCALDYFENLAKSKKQAYLYEVTQALSTEYRVELDIVAVKNVINLRSDNLFCFGDVVINKQQVDEINKYINNNLKSGTFDVTKVQQQFGIDINAVTELANYCGTNLKFV